MVQNHILQIVSLLTMNAPVTFTDVDIRREKISALKALQLYTPEEVKNILFVDNMLIQKI